VKLVKMRNEKRASAMLVGGGFDFYGLDFDFDWILILIGF
jgi:hypothetical protein